MADKSVRVEIKGLKELDRAFRQVNVGLKGELKVGLLEAARKVVSLAQGKLRGDVRGGKGNAADSIVPRASDQGASVAFGGSRAPYMPWLDFGGSVGQGHKAGVPWSGAIKREWRGKPGGDGRYIYPSIKEAGPDIRRDVGKAVEDAARKAGFETRGKD